MILPMGSIPLGDCQRGGEGWGSVGPAVECALRAWTTKRPDEALRRASRYGAVGSGIQRNRTEVGGLTTSPFPVRIAGAESYHDFLLCTDLN